MNYPDRRNLKSRFAPLSLPACVLVASSLSILCVDANPVGGTVTQGSATITSQGSQLTIQTSDHAAINWQSFNIAAGQTTTFLQPSSTSVVLNQINDVNPSRIMGNLNANGYVILENSSGFFIGGQATISTKGFFMTTAPMPMPDLSHPGAWQFSAPPPTARIINYGQINVSGGGPAFLIAHDIQNHGTITAEGGNVGLYAGKEVLVSERPDGRGLSAKVTLPEGSVDNSGKLIADAGTIEMNAQVVNQGGLVQANSARSVNGVIELVASDSLNLNGSSVISAKGGTEGSSAGGSVALKSDGQYQDAAGSVINVSGGAQGGNGGQIEISAPQINSLQSRIDGHAAAGSRAGQLVLDPQTINLANSGDSAPASGTVNAGDPPTTLTLNVDSFNNLISQNLLSQITLAATQDINVNTLWTLPASQTPNAGLTLEAGRNINFANGSGIQAGNNWGVTLMAGPQNLTSRPAAGTDGIYFNGNSYLQTQNGDINLWAANEILLNSTTYRQGGTGNPVSDTTGNGTGVGVRTTQGGNISAVAEYGDINTGANFNGYLFGLKNAPYYKVSPNVGGISTEAGGNVTITAGGNVTSYVPQSLDANSQFDGGSGAFGPEPGNVTITAGGSIYGHYVLANGTGTLTAGQDIGVPLASLNRKELFALSLIDGTWNVSAPNGNIYVQDINNPNGSFNSLANFANGNVNPGQYLFDYDSAAGVVLNAGNSVEITGNLAIRPTEITGGDLAPLFLPPSLSVVTGSGGFVLDHDVTLLPSPKGELNITTTAGGDFTSVNNNTLEMSDSAANQYVSPTTFGEQDHAATPPELNNPNPVVINVNGSIKNVTVVTTKETEVTVGGDTENFNLLAENLHPSDVSFVNVAGKISYSPVFTFTSLTQGIQSPNTAVSSSWDAIFALLVNPAISLEVPPNVLAMTPAQQTAYFFNIANGLRLDLNGNSLSSLGYSPNANPGFVYDSQTGKLGFAYQMSLTVRNTLEAINANGTQNLDAHGNPAVQIFKLDQSGHIEIQQDPATGKYFFATTTASFAPTTVIQTLYTQSQQSVPATHISTSLATGLQIGGPGKFDITANSIDFGSSYGFISWGTAAALNAIDYSYLKPYTPSGAEINVNSQGDINLISSAISSVGGGDVNVKSASGGIFLTQGDAALIPPPNNTAYGIYTSGSGDVNVEASQNIEIGASRIGTFGGGNIIIKSDNGTVDAGNGANFFITIPELFDPGFIKAYGSGVLAVSPESSINPGNITIETPRGDIVSTLGGIQQYVINGTSGAGPSITLTAGTAPVKDSMGNVIDPGFAGNVNLGQGGVIGGTVNISAQGSITGLIISRQNANISAQQNFSGTLLSGGTANVTATSGSVSGTIIGITGATVSGGLGVGADVQSQNASIGGAQAQSTLGTSATPSAASQNAAATANSDAKEQLAQNNGDDDEKKKSKSPVLTRKVGRVTVILPKA